MLSRWNSLPAQAEIKRDFLLAPVLATTSRKPKWVHHGVAIEKMIPLACPFQQLVTTARCWGAPTPTRGMKAEEIGTC